jgi:threonine dehydratase
VLVSEDEIAAAIRHAFLRESETIEGAGAVGIAALLAGKVTARGPVAVVVSGGNIDAAKHRQIISADQGIARNIAQCRP